MYPIGKQTQRIRREAAYHKVPVDIDAKMDWAHSSQVARRAYRPLVCPVFTTWPVEWPVSDAALANPPAGFSGRKPLVTPTTPSRGDGGRSSLL